jgi:hypothetical protein
MRALVQRSLPLLVASLVLLCAWARPASAQCSSNASSCVSCHETQGLRPILQGTLPWHVDHGFGDLCTSCHGGDPRSSVKELAHASRRSPLADPEATCAGCHERDAQSLAARYLATPRPPSVPSDGDGGAGEPRADAAGGALASQAARASQSGAARTAQLALSAAAVLLGGLLAWLLLRGSRSLPERSLGAWLRAKSWSAYAAGAGLGVVVAYAELVPGKTIAVSGAIDKLAAYPGAALFPKSTYYAHALQPEITWQVWMLLGLLGGAFASSWLSGEVRKRWHPDAQWVPRFGSSVWLRLGLAFVGAVLVQIGAGIAGGCTSGLAISGGTTLSPGAFVFMAGMFLGGIPTAWLWYRTWRGR